MKRRSGFICLGIFCLSVISSFRKSDESLKGRPKIVVGLMVDQMRWDYLYKYWDRYGEGGFKRLLKEGFKCENTMVRHIPTATACGHSSVYTGSVPAINGIVENSWYDRGWGKEIISVQDSTVKMVGTQSRAGRSPRNLLTTTIGDELRIATNYQSKVIGIALKDRASILPGGHTANAAFWRDQGKFTTSTYYMDTLPGWVNRFNAIDWADSLMPDGWHTLYPIGTYKLSDADNKSYEKSFYEEEKAPVFPHMKTPFRSTPFANDYTLEFAKAAIEGYKLGESGFTDLLAISLSAPDIIGHEYGPTSIEMEDNYLRLDKALAGFLSYLDRRFGKNGYLFFLTADHGADQSPGYLKEHKIPSGAVNGKKVMKDIKKNLEKKFGASDLILTVSNGQVYLNYRALDREGLDKDKVARFIAGKLQEEPGIAHALVSADLTEATLPERVKSMYMNGIYPGRSGDVLIMKSAGWQFESIQGAEHGEWYPFDAHIPLIWMGKGIHPGATHRTIWMTDIAPTLAAILHIQMPSGNIGDVITEITDRR